MKALPPAHPPLLAPPPVSRFEGDDEQAVRESIVRKQAELDRLQRTIAAGEQMDRDPGLTRLRAGLREACAAIPPRR